MKTQSIFSFTEKHIIAAFVLLSLFLFCLSTSITQAADIDDTTKEMCNQVMLNIYYDIVALREKYPELVNFGDEAMHENKHGLYTLIYKIDDPKVTKQSTPFAFGLTIDRTDENVLPKQPGSFAFPFSLIDVKFSGYQHPYLRSTQFNLIPLIEKHGIELAIYQQKKMPLRLYSRSIKEIYKINEPVEFEVILKNVGKTHYYVRELDQKNLYFVYNNRSWGTRPKIKMPSSKGRKKKSGKLPRKTLKSGESMSLILKGDSFRKPQDVEIMGVYKMNINGVTPSGLLNIRVEE